VIASVGVLAANALYFALSALGLGALHELSAEAFLAIKWLGAAYLVYLGVRTIARSFQRRAEGPEPGATSSAQRAFWQGFVSQGANPGLLVYFAAILPQFVNPAEALAPQLGILALSSFAIELAVLSGYAALAHRAGRRATPRLRAAIDRVGGGLLIAAGAASPRCAGAEADRSTCPSSRVSSIRSCSRSSSAR
jgi:threonine/homoserine/homoserine lactone efflux protein